MKRLLSILWANAPGLMLLALTMGVVTGVCNTVMLGLINKAIHTVGDAPSWLLTAFIVVCLLLPLSLILSQYVLVHFTQRTMYDLRMHLVEGILGAPLRKLEALGGNTLLASLTTDVTTISNTLVSLPGMIMQVAIVFSVVVYLWALFWPAAAGMLAALALGLACYEFVRRVGSRNYARARNDQDDLFKHFESLTMGAKELQLHEQRSRVFVDELLHGAASSFMLHSRRGSVYFATAASLGRFIFFAVIGVFVFILPGMLAGIDKETLTGYTIALLYLITPLEVITSVVPMISNASISLRKVNRIGADLMRARVDRRAQSAPILKWRSLKLSDITHAYHVESEDRAFIMGPINLEFKPGELVFLVGGNGSGKTTLAKLILGLYIPENGGILLDGKPVNNMNRADYRQLFSAVFVDFHLFDRLIGIEPDELDQRAHEYLKLLKLDHKVKVENGCLSTTDLSQGQRKRLALLTAYLEDRPVYLFDEWAADQDPSFKRVFYRKLLPDLRARGKTVIVISHDDAYYDVGDRIIKLDYGQVKLDMKLNDENAPSPLSLVFHHERDPA